MKKLLAILLAAMMIFGLAACTTGGGEQNPVNNDDKGEIGKVFDTQIPGLPDYPYGEMVREEKHDDGSGSFNFYNTTFEEFQSYCISLTNKGIVPENENLDFYTETSDSDRYYCKNEDAGYDYSIRFYEEPNSMTRVTNGVEEKIYWHVSIGYGPIK